MKLTARIARLEQRILTESQLDLKSLIFDELAVMLLDASRDPPRMRVCRRAGEPLTGLRS